MGLVAAIAIILILVVALAGLGVAFVNALADSVWGTFTVAMTIPLGMFMGMWMYVWRKGRITEATIIGVIGLLLALWAGEPISHSDSWFAGLFHLSRTQIVIALGVYGFAASMMPVWLLLSPRGYLSSFTKIGTIFLLALGVIIVNPEFKMPALSEFAGGGGPIIPGPLFPFCFITIACGAISGFHALISSGTTPKMIDKESDIRPVGYGAMLVEGVVGIMALIAAASMAPGDYFAINTPPAVYANLTFQGQQLVPVNVPAIEAGRRRNRHRAHRRRGVAGRRHGADLLGAAGHAGPARVLVSLRDHVRGAVHPDDDRLGHARRPLPAPGIHGPRLHAVRAARQHFRRLGRDADHGVVVGLFHLHGTDRPRSGRCSPSGNQLLASVALAVGTSILINLGRTKYIWVTLVPLVFLGTNTLYGGYLNITGNYYPLAVGANAARNMEGWILTICTVVMMVLAVIILGAAVQKWISVLNGGPVPATAETA